MGVSRFSHVTAGGQSAGLVVVGLLRRGQLVVETLQCQQFLVCPSLSHVTALYDKYTVSILDGGQTVCNDDTRATLPGLVQCLLNDLHIDTSYLCPNLDLSPTIK